MPQKTQMIHARILSDRLGLTLSAKSSADP
jgi:hypothetical protein